VLGDVAIAASGRELATGRPPEVALVSVDRTSWFRGWCHGSGNRWWWCGLGTATVPHDTQTVSAIPASNIFAGFPFFHWKKSRTFPGPL